MTNQEFNNQIAELRENLAMTREMLDQGTIQEPVRHYEPEERIDLVSRTTRPAWFRRAIPGINCPDATTSWQDIAEFRAKWGLPPVTR